MNKHIKPETAALFDALGFTPVDPAEVMMDWRPHGPLPETETPATFYHAGIDTYFAYAPIVVDGMWDPKLDAWDAIAVVDHDSTKHLTHLPDVGLELIELKDLPELVAQRAFNPAFFDLRIAKRCVAYSKQELTDLRGDERPTRDQYRKARKALKEASKHLHKLVVPRYRSVLCGLQTLLAPTEIHSAHHRAAL